MRVLCVAEKPSIAKALASILSRGSSRARNGKNKYCKNYDFSAEWPRTGGQCQMTMTSVLGHLKQADFEDRVRRWNDCDPVELFRANIVHSVADNMKDVANNLRAEARGAQVLVIWTDCDREGENIGSEIVEVCQSVNSRLEVLRGRFSVVQAREIYQAMRTLIPLDHRQAEAVNARIELDLRIGAAFTRFQTLRFRNRFQELDGKLISYGSCQFPTLGFIVEQYWARERFVSEPFWSIQVSLQKEGLNTSFSWERGHLFDRLACLMFYEQCVQQPLARVTSVSSRPTSKWRPLPLTTVAMQKMGASNLRISSDRMMAIAESLYNKGFLSYPRTETDQFDDNFNLHELIEKQVGHPEWGQYAQGLLDGNFKRPRKGQHNDKAHPPIHPTKLAHDLTGDDKRVYDFVTRNFLACCSEDALGQMTNVDIDIAGEKFSASGLQVLARNYLDVYTYENWTDRPMPMYNQGETLQPSTLQMTEGKTAPPSYLSEASLIATMDKNGIGTDATIAEHIKKILDREYAFKQRGLFVPSKLGLALVEGYDEIGFDSSLAKPFLRSEMERSMVDICNGRRQKEEVVRESVAMYQEMFEKANEQAIKLQQAMEKYFGHAPDLANDPMYGGNGEDGGGGHGANGAPRGGAFGNNPATGKCTKCGSNMILKSKREGGWFVGCQTYPTCQEVIWLPNAIMTATISDEQCPRCNESIKLNLIVDATKAPTGTILQQRLCVRTGCDPQMTTLANALQQHYFDSNQQQRPQAGALGAGAPTSAFNANGGPPAPLCECQQTSVQRTVMKESANQGRTFYCCASKTCDFFQWADEMQPARGSSSTTTTTTMATTMVPLQTSFRGSSVANGQKPKCNCDLFATLKVVTKNGENQGKKYYTCTKAGKKCNYFAWADEQGNVVEAGGSFSNGTCYQCGKPGHFASACPNPGAQNVFHGASTSRGAPSSTATSKRGRGGAKKSASTRTRKKKE